MTIQAGDVLAFVFAQPGNDTTYLLVESIEGQKATCWDLMFWMAVADIDISELRKASEHELQSSFTCGLPRHPGTFTVQQAANERAAQRTSE
jgi:hypothetical protein